MDCSHATAYVGVGSCAPEGHKIFGFFKNKPAESSKGKLGSGEAFIAAQLLEADSFPVDTFLKEAANNRIAGKSVSGIDRGDGGVFRFDVGDEFLALAPGAMALARRFKDLGGASKNPPLLLGYFVLSKHAHARPSAWHPARAQSIGGECATALFSLAACKVMRLQFPKGSRLPPALPTRPSADPVSFNGPPSRRRIAAPGERQRHCPRQDSGLAFGGAEEHQVNELMKSALDKFSDFLYSIAPGFVLLISLMLADPDGKQLGVQQLFGGDAGWNGIGLGFLLGILSYSFHLAVLEDVMACGAIWLVRRWNKDVEDKFVNDTCSQIIPKLTRNRWARLASANKFAATAQLSLDETYLWQFFLYCSGYLMVIGAFVALWKVTIVTAVLFLAVGALFLVSALASDFKTFRHEMWLAKNLPSESVRECSCSSSEGCAVAVGPATEPGGLGGASS